MSFFFFQAEDGIRDLYVTGVQTCALPISHRGPAVREPEFRAPIPAGPDELPVFGVAHGTTCHGVGRHHLRMARGLVVEGEAFPIMADGYLTAVAGEIFQGRHPG